MSKFKHTSAILFFLLASVFITYPLLFHMGDYVTGYGDELVIAWIQTWVIHIVSSGNIFSLFNANLYYPFHNSFAYSEQFLTSSVLSWIPLHISRQPISVVNFTFISSLFLLGVSVYTLAYYVTRNFWASLLSGTCVVFSPAVLDKAVHLQILSIQYVPFAMLFFLLFFDTTKTRYLLISLVFFLLQTYNSFVPGYFIIFSYLFIFGYYLVVERKKVLSLITPRHILLCIAACALIIPIMLPYFQVSKEYHYVRDIRDTIHFALQPEDFLYTGTSSRLQDLLLKIPIKQTSVYQEIKPGFIGLTFTVITLVSLFYFFKTLKKHFDYTTIFTSIGLFGLVLSLGPFLHINRVTIHHPFPIPLPYGLLYYIIPGFKGIRDTERWEMLAILAFAIVSALVLHRLLKKISLNKQISIYVFLIICVITEFKFPLHFYPVPQVKNFPKVYSFLATTPKDTKVIFLPIFNWNQFPYTQEEIWREYYSTIEFRPMVNGYTGFSSIPWQKIVSDMWSNFPYNLSISELHQLGLTYIIVDKNLYDTLYKDHRQKLTGQMIITILEKNPKVRLMKVWGNEYVFAFR